MTDKESVEPQHSKHSSKSHAKRKFPIVGIGASAGGLEACTALLRVLPPHLGMAYVVLPHLDPLRESAFSDILSRTTKMPVVDAQDKTTVEGGQRLPDQQDHSRRLHLFDAERIQHFAFFAYRSD